MPLHHLGIWKSLRTSAPFHLALLLLVLTLFVSLIGGASLYSLFREAKEDELDQRLIAVGTAAEPSIADAAEFTMRSLVQSDRAEDKPESDAAWIRWFQVLIDLDAGFDNNFPKIGDQLRALQKNARLTSVLLISPQKRVIADPSGQYPPGTLAPLVEMDSYAWEPVLEGAPYSIPYYEFNQVPYKRVYVPILLRHPANLAGKVGAVLRLEASLDAFQQIKRLRTRSLGIAFVITGLLGTVAFLFYRLIRVFARIEASAAHRDRLEAMGVMVAGIAHEIRNPLGIIRALAEGLATDTRPGDPAREMVDDIVGEVERLNTLVTQYLVFARPETGDPGDRADPGEIIRGVTTLIEKGNRESANIVLEIAEDTPPVRMSTPALRQVLLNLVLNAREASPAESAVTVRCRLDPETGRVEIRVSDRGAGIPARDLKRIFEPFYTTKTRGSGLGLSICRHLVEECRGKIHVESTVGAGTTVRVLLPTL